MSLAEDYNDGMLYEKRNKPKQEKETSMDNKWEFYVAGVQHHLLKTVIQDVKVGDKLILNDGDNPGKKFDPNAVAILFEQEMDGKPIQTMTGFVPAKNGYSAEVSAFLSWCENVECTVLAIEPANKPWEQLRVVIRELHNEDDVVEDSNV